MIFPVNIIKMQHINTIVPDVSKGKKLLSTYAILQEAKDYLLSFTWCQEILEGYVGLCVEPVVGVFLFRIKHDGSADDWLWVVTGDLPPAYIAVSAETPNGACALDGYIGEMEHWVDAVRAGQTQGLDDIIPVNAPPTPENADHLAKCLKFLDEKILCDYPDDLESGASL